MNRKSLHILLLAAFLPVLSYGSGQEQINWLIAQQNLSSSGLVDSYEADGTNRAYLYDQALAIIAFTSAAEYSRAASIIEALRNLQQSNGVWYECYDVNNLTTPETLRKYNTGPISWIVCALNFYESQSSDSNYTALARAALAWLSNMRVIDPCDERYGAIRYCDGPDCSFQQVVSTEHNADAYSAFYWRAVLDDNDNLRATADSILDYLAREMWGQSENHNCLYDVNVFWEGFGDCNWCTDCQSWTTLALGPFGPNRQNFHNAMDWIWFNQWGNTRTTQDFNNIIKSVNGFKSCTDESNNYIWVEATDGVAMAFYRICDWQKGDYFHQQTSRLVSANGGLPHTFSQTNPQTIRWPDNWRYNSVAATCWHYFAEKKINPFDLSSVNSLLAADNDFNKIINFTDYAVFSNAYNHQGLGNKADLNNDCRIDNFDLILLAENWLKQIN